MSKVNVNDPDAFKPVLLERLHAQPFWSRRLNDCISEPSTRLHLAVFHEPFLSLLLAGKKTIESRFSANRVAPYEAVGRDDLILLKRASGPVVGMALAGDPGFYALDSGAWSTILGKFGKAICVPDNRFWDQRSHARYATLIPIRAVVELEPFAVAKRDRRGWVPISRAHQPELLFDKRLRA